MNALGITELARAAGVTPKHARRILVQIRNGKRTYWRGATPNLASVDPLSALLITLPQDVREAVIMWDQMPLPLTAPRDQFKSN